MVSKVKDQIPCYVAKMWLLPLDSNGYLRSTHDFTNITQWELSAAETAASDSNIESNIDFCI